jgi:hypothetical protein
VWILEGETPVPKDVVIVGTDGERTAVTGIDEGAAVIVSEKARP